MGLRDKAWNQGYDGEAKLGTNGTKVRMERQSLEPRLGWIDKAWNQG